MKLEFKDYIAISPSERLDYFLKTLSATNRTPEYYVNWDKVVTLTKKYELELNTLNYLIGKENIYEEATVLFTKQPQLIKAIPSLIASRDDLLDILTIDEKDEMNFYQLDFKNIKTEEIEAYVDFCQQAGLLDFLKKEANRSLVDYVYGVEAGLDSNARKNRSGTTMEGILERNVAKLCNELGLEHQPQASAKFIKEKWNVEVPVDKSARRFDEAIFDSKTNRLWLIETNYYGGGGSKLKSVAGEFTTLNQLISTSQYDVTFVWVTDGQGWLTTKIPMLEAFGHVSYIFNLQMLRDDYLKGLLQRH